MLLKAACKSGALERFSVFILWFLFKKSISALSLYLSLWLVTEKQRHEVTNKITTAVYLHHYKL